MADDLTVYVPSGANSDPWRAHSTADLVTATQRRHSSSTSPASADRIPTKTAKRKRSILFWGRHSSSESGDDCDYPFARSPRRSSSLLSWLSLGSRKSSTKYDNMQGMEEIHNEQPTTRRKSSLARLKDLFIPNKRKDSGTATGLVQFDPFNPDHLSGPHEQGELTYYNSSLEPYGMNGILRFQNSSSYDDPSSSTYYRGETYRNRPCTILPQPVCSSVRSEWAPENSVFTRRTNAEASIGNKSQHHESPMVYSPTGAGRSNRNHARQGSFRAYTPNFFQVRSSRRQRQLNGATVRTQHSGGVARNVSVAHSVFSTRRFRANPAPFGTGPNLRLHSIEELGVLPLIEEPSVESELDVPHPQFSYPSASSSTVAIHTTSPRSASRVLCQCPSPSTNPAIVAPSPVQCPPSPSINATSAPSSGPQSSIYIPAPGIEVTPSEPPSRVPTVFHVVDSPARSRNKNRNRNRNSTASPSMTVYETLESEESKMSDQFDNMAVRANNSGEANPVWEEEYEHAKRPGTNNTEQRGERMDKWGPDGLR